MVETWSYNPINYYLLIFRSGKIITHIECDEVYDAVSHLLTLIKSLERDKKLNKILD
jgi:hypothetical protein